MKTTTGYFRHSFRPAEKRRTREATSFAAGVLQTDRSTSSVSVTVKNRRNPNGITVTVTRDGEHTYTTEATRFIMTTWAREHGYWDACETPKQRRAFYKKFPNQTPDFYRQLYESDAYEGRVQV